MKPEGSRNVLAPPTQAGRIGDFLLNLGWSLFWLVRSAARVLRRRLG
ncbi:MAG: hypothetical protein ACFNLO_03765 [Selenomonas massiliensis]